MNPTQSLPSTATTATLVRTIEWVDTDAAGHQHNSAVLRFVEACEAKLFRGLDLPEYFPSAPRVRHELNYRAKLYFGQQVTTTVVVEKIGRTSMTFSFEVWGEEFRGEPRVQLPLPPETCAFIAAHRYHRAESSTAASSAPITAGATTPRAIA